MEQPLASSSQMEIAPCTQMEMGHGLMPRGPQILFMIGIYMYLPSNFRDIYYFDPFEEIQRPAHLKQSMN